MTSRKRPAARPKNARETRKRSGVSIDLDQLERIYSHEHLIDGRKDQRDRGKRDDGDGIKREDSF